jgi:putative glutamine amidotransferase
MKARPGIGITVGSGEAWAPGGRHYESYATAVREAGGEPLRLAPGETLEERWAGLGGVLFSGGWDVDLRHYPRPPDLAGRDPEAVMRERRMTMDGARDLLELPLPPRAIREGKAVLGICRGCQLLNVALGGQLILDIGSECPAALNHRAGPPPDEPSGHHLAEVDPGSLLAEAADCAGLQPVNSRHHQAVHPDGLAPGLRVVARSHEDGIVEAVDAPEMGWVVGVQWHPERAADAAVRERWRELFRAFVAAARGR